MVTKRRFKKGLILEVPRVTNINFLLLVHQDTGLQKLLKSSLIRENAMILNQILSTSFLRKFKEISVENFNVDNIGT